MANKTLTPEDLAKLRSRLPRGYQQKVADALRKRYSRQYVGHVANGIRTNETVLAALIQFAQESTATAARFRKVIEKL